jgi:hypothetical protein
MERNYESEIYEAEMNFRFYDIDEFVLSMTGWNSTNFWQAVLPALPEIVVFEFQRIVSGTCDEVAKFQQLCGRFET